MDADVSGMTDADASVIPSYSNINNSNSLSSSQSNNGSSAPSAAKDTLIFQGKISNKRKSMSASQPVFTHSTKSHRNSLENPGQGNLPNYTDPAFTLDVNPTNVIPIESNRYDITSQGPYDVVIQTIDNFSFDPIFVGRTLYSFLKKDICEIRKIGFSKINIKI
ncbi:glycosyl hydrolase family 65 central catalytic domain protein [Lasius niger]|uniref:Glycosyl hydrolase family 65 central catalytic domain protein n=1 Tax=Lasius niger TaxID=67767 RepID=A0A0J7K3G8_LASNI|nr:glycosyl hydrolase family 65 central catalytic domain protein [Lasius niger]